jgi:dienelactone hydrolase
MQTDSGSRLDREDSGASVDEDPSEVEACEVVNTQARCASRTIEMIGAASDKRRVYWARPTKPAPTSGYPAVILYQGSYFGPATTWNVDVEKSMAFGGYHQVRVVAQLLERGYVVIQPEAQGGTFWSTNISAAFASSSDGVFVPTLLAAMEGGTFGTLDDDRLYATGMSSGGYMTSRMAVSFAGRFRALAIHSAAYATCGGPLCSVPSDLPADHPPTLFLHGAADTIVPIATAKDYDSELRATGIETEFIEEPRAGHEWLAVAPDEIATWFDRH